MRFSGQAMTVALPSTSSMSMKPPLAVLWAPGIRGVVAVVAHHPDLPFRNNNVEGACLRDLGRVDVGFVNGTPLMVSFPSASQQVTWSPGRPMTRFTRCCSELSGSETHKRQPVLDPGERARRFFGGGRQPALGVPEDHNVSPVQAERLRNQEIDEDAVIDFQGFHHGSGRDEERPEQEGLDQEGQHHGNDHHGGDFLEPGEYRTAGGLGAAFAERRPWGAAVGPAPEVPVSDRRDRNPRRLRQRRIPQRRDPFRRQLRGIGCFAGREVRCAVRTRL